VERGKNLFEDKILKFFSSMDDSVRQGKPNVIIFSSVLQYLETPLAILGSATETGAGTIIIDRTPFLNTPDNKIAVQRAPRDMGRWSLPVWLFSRDQLLAPVSKRYRILAEYDAIDGTTSYGFRRVDFKGLILDKMDRVEPVGPP
jgi:putative methyltransferase (TIGR04325 family)